MKRNFISLKTITKLRNYIINKIIPSYNSREAKDTTERNRKKFKVSIMLKNSITLKIIGIVSLFIIVTMIIVGGIIYGITYNKMLNMSRENMKIISEEISNNFDNLILVQNSDVEKISVDSDVRKLVLQSVNNSRDNLNSIEEVKSK